jgi:hypothetical protein
MQMKKIGFVSVAILLVSAVAIAGGGKQIDEHDYKVKMPAEWKELPDLADQAKQSVLAATTDIDGGAIAYGDVSKGVFSLGIWVVSKKKVNAVRTELTAFHDGIKSSLAATGNLKISKYDLSETATRMQSRIEGANDQLAIIGVSVGLIDKDGVLHGWSMQCMYVVAKAKDVAPLCEAMLATFGVTFNDANARPLEKKK